MIVSSKATLKLHLLVVVAQHGALTLRLLPKAFVLAEVAVLAWLPSLAKSASSHYYSCCWCSLQLVAEFITVAFAVHPPLRQCAASQAWVSINSLCVEVVQL